MHLPLLDQALGSQDPGIPCWNDSTLSQPLPQAPPPRSGPCLQCTQAVGKVQLFAGAWCQATNPNGRGSRGKRRVAGLVQTAVTLSWAGPLD